MFASTLLLDLNPRLRGFICIKSFGLFQIRKIPSTALRYNMYTIIGSYFQHAMNGKTFICFCIYSCIRTKYKANQRKKYYSISKSAYACDVLNSILSLRHG